MNYRYVLCVLSLTVAVAGCGNGSGNTNFISSNSSSLLDGAITLHGDQATLHPQSGPEATITSTGDFSIDGKPISTNSAEHALLLQYFQNVQAVRDHGLETGRAGLAVAGAAMKGVAKGLTGGDTDQINKDVDARSKAIEDTALKICTDLGGIKAAQDQLATQLSSFEAYAHMVSAQQVTDCVKEDDDDKDKNR